jgi:CDP-glucose 4,6-dehydratase
MTPASAWRRRSVLVTGATGLIGSWLVKELLAAEADVVALIFDSDPRSELVASGDIARVHAVPGALEDIGVLERAVVENAVHTVFHLGAQTIVGAAQQAPWDTFETNIRGTYNVLEVCRRHPQLVRSVVVASSDKAYGEQTLPYTEESPLVGRNPYDVSKSCADLLAQAYHASYGVPVTIARCGNVYGGGDLNWSRIVPGTIRDLLEGRRPVVRSDGRRLRDYLYVKDAVSAFLRLALSVDRARVAGQAFNFSEESPRTVLQVVDAVKQIMGCDAVDVDIQNRATGEIADQYLSAGRARSVLGWSPAYTFEAGLRETIAWYRAHFGSPARLDAGVGV